MAEEKLLTIREAALILGICEREVMELAESGKIPAYKIGGLYLRFKRQQLEDYQGRNRAAASPAGTASVKYSWKDRINDFFYFNDFYILSFLIVVLLLMIILQGY